MATFAKSTFNAASYASFRPTYPRSLFEFIYTYHAQSGRAGWETVVDLGCGTGQATLEVADQFKEAVGCDPSEGMVKNARLAAEQSGRAQKPEFVVSPAEKLSFLGDSSVDMAIAAQAAHWFDYKALFPELARVLKPGGTVALWNYAELRFGGRPDLDPLISEYSHSDESLGPHWQQPGRSILEGYLQKVPVPTCAPWDPTSIRRVYYVGDHEPSLQGEKLPIILRKHLTWDAFNSYLRTWSSLHDYLVKHPDDKDSEGRDIVDRFIREVYEKGEKLPGTNAKVWREGFVAEWPLVLLLLKKAHK
ncbi:putative S-adenosylmethionine-dependent methyltransferase [Rhizoctonia solani 123E]|uniref:Putative S-adenosylmethionine-dependent methyltransferase n=1 Tax=Rhizoctonia solani 123E TaxID=1423351 RepID=A0A074SAV7_9AGAM|nr:putative S-adenosylmethionine-dependent methyltransferase [Rhizoctonia solani 123E]